MAASKTIHQLLERDPETAGELLAAGIDAEWLANAVKARAGRGTAEDLRERPMGMRASDVGLSPSVRGRAESIIELAHRPTLLVMNNDFEVPPDEMIAERLKQARARLAARLPSVGRVEIFDGAMKFPIGTAWMVAENIAITNRHVAEAFAFRDATGTPQFERDLRNRPLKAFVDFAEEHGSVREDEFEVTQVLYLAPRDGEHADIALLKLANAAGKRAPAPIPLAVRGAKQGAWAAVVGYPQRDSRLPEESRLVEERYFSRIYGVKRLAPGQIDVVGPPGHASWLIEHDATTLGGNSGSVLLDFDTGAAVGLHFAGAYRVANYAVASDEILRVLRTLGVEANTLLPSAPPNVWSPDTVAEEGATESLAAFTGYSPVFISKRGNNSFEIPLPQITTRAPGAIAELEAGGTVLPYRNFSVVMNADRRLCYFSAVNVDGASTFSIRGKRPGWKLDPRLDAALQIRDECYGEERAGKFSRGHMTRREDPNWGPNRSDAEISNRHTFYVTNACPQIQSFNAGIWLSLEDYALQNCDQDDMRICVFTGPIFRDQDPTYFGVRVPVTFWKIIAFRHDKTKKLSATGYLMSQESVLPTDDEFVFGQFKNAQVTIRSIEAQTGLSFHHLHQHDPFDDGTESTATRSLRMPTDIVF